VSVNCVIESEVKVGLNAILEDIKMRVENVDFQTLKGLKELNVLGDRKTKSQSASAGLAIA